MKMIYPRTMDVSWPYRSLATDLWSDMLSDFDRVVDSFANPSFARTAGFVPTCDIQENQSQYVVSFDMPGVHKEDIKIEVQGNQLMVSGERRHEMSSGDRESALRRERSYGKFERTFTLPQSVQTEKIEAHYENGVLNLVIPKAEAAKGRTIQIQSGSGGVFSKLLGSKKENNKDSQESKLS